MTIHVLIADDERAARHGMAKALASCECKISEAEDGKAALDAIRSEMPDLVFLDLSMPVLDGLGVLGELGSVPLGCEIIVVTANDSIRSAVECMRLGAADYITKPFEIEQLRAIVRRVASRRGLERRAEELQSRLDEKHAFGALVGISQPMKELFRRLERAARAPVDVLIRGETGTGKELIAREIHRLGDRAKGPFVAVNTSAITESLAESELFGHVRGAFTGAENTRPGFFEQAHGGILFLDEIGDMSLTAQAKILRVLQDRAVRPVGATRSLTVDVRIICATHQDLEQAVKDGNFRQDLYYRVKGIELFVPPLRSRREDVLLLANYFLERFSASAGTSRSLAADAVDALLGHSWPGNVRELEHAISAAAAMATGDVIRAADLGLPHTRRDTLAPDVSSLAEMPLTEAKAQLTDWFERTAISAALDKHAGNVSAAARQLGIHRQSLQQKIVQLGIRKTNTVADGFIDK